MTWVEVHDTKFQLRESRPNGAITPKCKNFVYSDAASGTISLDGRCRVRARVFTKPCTRVPRLCCTSWVALYSCYCQSICQFFMKCESMEKLFLTPKVERPTPWKFQKPTHLPTKSLAMSSMIYDLTSGGEEEDDAAWATDTASFMNEFLSGPLTHTLPSPVRPQPDIAIHFLQTGLHGNGQTSMPMVIMWVILSQKDFLIYKSLGTIVVWRYYTGVLKTCKLIYTCKICVKDI